MAATAAVYLPVRDFGFSRYDDRPYIEWNERVRSGLGWANARWAFTSFHQANWHPLTWLSHQADAEVHGLDPGGHHLTSLGLHLANAAALLALLAAMTGSLWRSALAAALFALHPLHVESVAWVAERKDVLSTILLLATLAAYLRHARRPSRSRLAAVAALLGLGLLAKPMLVTLPCALLLLDWWPLGRAPRGGAGAGSPGATPWRRLALEKLPLFALAAASSVVTLLAQRAGGAVQTLEAVPAGRRLANAAVSYATYLVKTAWPADLAALYPLAPDGPPAWQVAAALAALAAITWVAVRLRRAHPAAAVGWLWYLGTLVPVIGLIQAGVQAMADRYTYVPLVGVFIAAAWGAGASLPRSPRARAAAAVAVCAALVSLAAVARAQLWHWRDGGAVSARALAVAGSAVDAALEQAAMHEAHGDPVQAEAAYRRALGLAPDHAVALNNLGVLVFGTGRRGEGVALVQEATRAKPDYAEAHYNLGVLLSNQGRIAEAAAALEQAVRLKPGFAEPRELLTRLRGPARAGAAPPGSP